MAQPGCFINLNYMNIKKNKAIRYFIESYEELKKVAWPSREITRNHSILVISFSLGIGVYFGVADYLLNIVLEKLI